jgi:hypothetical protein
MHIGWLAEGIDLLFLIFGKTGKILSARASRLCFIVDSLCLFYWFYVDIDRQLYAQACSVCVGLIINLYGFLYWKKKGIGG